MAAGREHYQWERETRRERVVLVGVHLPSSLDGLQGGAADTLELARLVKTAGGDVCGVLEQRLQRPNPALLIGKGKLEELQDRVAQHDADLVVFDNDLAPNQGRNLQKALGDVRIIDRTELILDIFAMHARTRQACLQVELAQLEYLRPRLTRMWRHLERQAGGIGTRGPGETQLETDRRIIGRRIAHLKRQLAEVRSDRRTQTRGREGTFRAAFVGYTNAGKSTLMNAVTGAEVLVRDQLFATLDATTRRVEADERRRFLLTDTVGFIRRLPHHLVESFRATLQEVEDADLLVHVVDAGSEDPERQIVSVTDVLADIIPQGKATLLVFNKLDTVAEPEHFRNRFERLFPGSLFLSALAPGAGGEVREAIVGRLRQEEKVVVLRLPSASLPQLGAWHRTGDVLEQACENGVCTVTIRLREADLRRLQRRIPGLEEVAPQ